MTANLEAFFDTNWYCKRYPDVEKTGMQPLQHYLRYGERLGRKPGPAFDPLFYAENYPELADTESSLLAHFTAYGQRKGKRGYAQTIQELMQQLWRREHTADCIDALVAFTEKGPPGEVRSAAWVLARWFAFQEDWHYCAYWLRLYYQQPEPKVPWPVIQLMYCEALCRLGKPVEAEEEAQALKERFPDYYDANLAFSNIYLSKLESAPPGGSGSEQVSQLNARRIDVINTLLAQHGLRQIEGENNHQALTLDSIKPVDTHLKESQWGGAGLVSVIVPVFNAERFLATALKSLMVQSYPDLEVLIVDDASTDATRSIAEQFVAQDARFTLLCQPFNQGAYAARNHGLKHARGDYITVHDADDWSHPDKISCQLSAFDKNPEWLANTADMVRCTTNLRFGRWRLSNR